MKILERNIILELLSGQIVHWSGVEEKELPCKVLASPYFILFID